MELSGKHIWCLTYCREEDSRLGHDTADWLWEDEEPWQEEEEEGGWEYFAGEGEHQEEDKEEIVMDEAVGAEVLNEQEKLFVFLTGERICLPHQLGVTHCTALHGTARHCTALHPAGR